MNSWVRLGVFFGGFLGRFSGSRKLIASHDVQKCQIRPCNQERREGHMNMHRDKSHLHTAEL